MNSALEKRRNIARRINELVVDDSRVTCVYVFGSVASGDADGLSDLDLTMVCKEKLLPVSARVESLSQLGWLWEFDDPTLDNPIWDALDSGVVDGIPVEVHYQTAPSISAVLNEVKNEGALATATVPFRPYTVAGLVQRAWLLSDKDEIFNQWLEQTKVYPQALQVNILRHFMPILRQNAEEFSLQAKRKLGPLGCLYFLSTAGAALTSILFALNEIYDPADRRECRTILPILDHTPRDFLRRLDHILQGPFDDSGAALRAGLFRELATEVLMMAESQLA